MTTSQSSKIIRYSIVILVYNEAEVLSILYRQLTQVMEALGESYEVIFVNDGSRDASPVILRELRAKDKRVKFVSMLRNFGHQTAITAGLDYSVGEAVIVMDPDLQNPPDPFGGCTSNAGKGMTSSLL